MREPGWQKFRWQAIATLVTLDPDRFHYLHRDKVLGVCPSCRADLPNYAAVTFVGELSIADLYCSAGCPPRQLAAAFGLPPLPVEERTDERLLTLRWRRARRLADAGIGDYTTPSDWPQS